MSNIDFSKTYLTNGLSSHPNYRSRPAFRKWLTLLSASAALVVTALAFTD